MKALDTGRLVLEVQQLKVAYGEHLVLKGVSLSVASGEVLALIGPNGAGKTTLLKAISGVIKPSGGAVKVLGQNLLDLSHAQRASRLAVVPQAHQMPEGFTVRQTVLMGRTPYLGWLGKTGPKDSERIQWALEQTRTLDLADRRIEELSGGEQQRVLLARALAQDTPILLLDEPTTYLDLRHQASLLALVRQLSQEHGLAVLMALHDLNMVSLYSDRVALVVEGVLKAAGKAEEVLSASLLTEAYQIPLQVIPHPIYGTPLVLPDGRGEESTNPH